MSGGDMLTPAPVGEKNDLIAQFSRHKVACNLLMLLMLLAGVWGLSKLERRFFPPFELQYIYVTVLWSGASAEDLETGVVDVLEDRFRVLKEVKNVNSFAKRGGAAIWVEYQSGVDLNAAADEVENAISQARNLPEDAEAAKVEIFEAKELVLRLVLTGPEDVNEMRTVIKRMEGELLSLGVSKATINGLPKDEIAISVPQDRLNELGLSLPQLAQLIRNRSQDVPAGAIGRSDLTRELRSLEQRRRAEDFASLPVIADRDSRLIRLGDIATVERRPVEGSVDVRQNGRTAVEIDIYRSDTVDSLKTAERVYKWLEGYEPTLPPGWEVDIVDERWVFIQDRIDLLLKNGLSGLVLIIGILFIFLNRRVAFWVTVGIPVSFMATLMVLYQVGGSINMISMFGLIMALGIIVDDAIVVGEDALTHFQSGEDQLRAAEGGARRMFWPVVSSSLTTIAAFLPLMLIGGIMGSVMKTIPIVIICVIIASLIECFLILPGHLRGSFDKMTNQTLSPTRAKLEAGFDRFRDEFFRPFVTAALDNRRIVVCFSLAAMIMTFGLLAGKRVQFTFFNSPESHILLANVLFASGTPREEVAKQMRFLEDTLKQTDAELTGNPEGGLVVSALSYVGLGMQPGTDFTRTGDNYALMRIELLKPDQRDVRNTEIIRVWEDRVVPPAGMTNFAVFEPKNGPPGQDLEVRLSGADLYVLKEASEQVQAALRGIPGVQSIEDDTSWGLEQIIFTLTPEGEALGLTVADVGRQLRAAFDGELVQIFPDQGDDVEVRVLFPDEERSRVTALESLPIVLSDGQTVALGNIASFSTQRGFERIRHDDGVRAIKVTADIVEGIANTNEVRAGLQRDVLPELARTYGIKARFTGAAEDQDSTLGDMQRGLFIGLTLMYLTLAWVFGSYGWPLMVMAIIPFGLIGAIFGHWVMGLDLTLMSLFGFFGLSGIVVNDSIILVVFYRDLRAAGMPIRQALIEASCQRLRAVMLTSLTTIGGLTPIMFETSQQALFLVPMATAITFGLAFATVLVLIVVPTLLSLYEQVKHRGDEHALAPQMIPVPKTASKSS